MTQWMKVNITLNYLMLLLCYIKKVLKYIVLYIVYIMHNFDTFYISLVYTKLDLDLVVMEINT